jgi:hypothetical protein
MILPSSTDSLQSNKVIESLVYNQDYTLLKGSKPTKNSEVLVSDYLEFLLLKEFNINEVVGYEFYLSNMKFKVTGVVKTDYSLHKKKIDYFYLHNNQTQLANNLLNLYFSSDMQPSNLASGIYRTIFYQNEEITNVSVFSKVNDNLLYGSLPTTMNDCAISTSLFKKLIGTTTSDLETEFNNLTNGTLSIESRFDTFNIIGVYESDQNSIIKYDVFYDLEPTHPQEYKGFYITNPSNYKYNESHLILINSSIEYFNADVLSHGLENFTMVKSVAVIIFDVALGLYIIIVFFDVASYFRSKRNVPMLFSSSANLSP